MFRSTNGHTLRQYIENRIMNDITRSKIQKQIMFAPGLTSTRIPGHNKSLFSILDKYR